METMRWRSRRSVRDLLADGRCGQAVVDVLSPTDVGRLVSPLEENGGRGEVSDWELWERQEEREAEAEALGDKELRRSSPPPRSWHQEASMRGRVTLLFCSFLGKFP